MLHTTVTNMGMNDAKNTSITLGTVLIVIWFLAFISNPIVGPSGLFLTNRAHDGVHILSGLILLISGFVSEIFAIRTIQTFGIIYLIIAILGLLMGNGMLLGLIEINTWDNILHIVIAVVVLYLGFGVLKNKSNRDNM